MCLYQALKMDIPTDIPRRINPDIQDPISKSVIYTFTSQDFYIDNDRNMLYRFPYSKNTYWTNFKYTCFNITKNQYEQLDIGIELKTSDSYKYTIKEMEVLEDKKWYDTVWPIPSIYTYGSDACIDFKIKPPSDNKSIYNIVISLLGFMDLFPKVENYLLLSSLDTYQFVFAKYEQDDLEGARGSIYNVEHYDYIREIIVKACGVRLIKRY
jgi:hypothetical protein